MGRHNGIVAPKTPETVFCEERRIRDGNTEPVEVGCFLEPDFRQLADQSKHGIGVGEGVPSEYLAVRLSERGALDVCRVRRIADKETVKSRTIGDDTLVLVFNDSATAAINIIIFFMFIPVRNIGGGLSPQNGISSFLQFQFTPARGGRPQKIVSFLFIEALQKACNADSIPFLPLIVCH